MKPKWLGFAVALLAFFPSTAAIAQPPDALRDLAFLVGSWDAVPGPDGSRGGSTFRFDAQDRVLVRSNRAEYPATGGRPAATHEDLMVIYVEGAAPAKAIYFDNEGHVIRYTVSTASPAAVVLVSDAAPGLPRFRLSYSLLSKDRLAGEFASAKPDAPEAFAPMFRWEMVRKR